MVVDRKDAESEFLDLPNGEFITFTIVQDYTKKTKEVKNTKGGTFDSNDFTFIVNQEGKDETKKYTVWKKGLAELFKKADLKINGKVNSFVGSVWKVKQTVTEVNGKTNYDKKVECVSVPTSCKEI